MKKLMIFGVISALVICYLANMCFAECFVKEFSAFGIHQTYCFEERSQVVMVNGTMPAFYNRYPVTLQGELILISDGMLFLIIDGKPFSLSVAPWDIKP